MSRRVPGYSGVASWSHETDSRCVIFDVPFRVGDFWEQCWEHPAEGGEIELGDVKLTGFIGYSEDGDPERTLVDLSEYERFKIEQEYNFLIEKDWKTRETVYAACYETKVEDWR